MRITKKGSVLLGTAVLGSAAMVLPAAAHWGGSSSGDYGARLKPVPHDHQADQGSRVTGQATLHYNAETKELNVFVAAHGTSPNMPHLVHIHGDLAMKNDCPGKDARDRRVEDGLIDTVEGLPDYGPIQTTFSVDGGTGDQASPDALDLSRAPVSDSNGDLYYARSFPVSEMEGVNLDSLHVVIHGLDLNGNQAYDGPAGSLGADVPLEAELPVSCGVINQ